MDADKRRRIEEISEIAWNSILFICVHLRLDLFDPSSLPTPSLHPRLSFLLRPHSDPIGFVRGVGERGRARTLLVVRIVKERRA
jgi:hypothetical protein